jgi:hypothetical protein
MKKKIHLGYDLSWTYLDDRWRSPGSWSHTQFPDIRLYEEIAQIAEPVFSILFFSATAAASPAPGAAQSTRRCSGGSAGLVKI